jgi:hypothetical protein
MPFIFNLYAQEETEVLTPIIVGTANSFVTTAATTHPINIPAGSVGDLIVTFFVYTGTSTTFTMPEGATNLASSGPVRSWYYITNTTGAHTVNATTLAVKASSHVTYRISNIGPVTFIEGVGVVYPYQVGVTGSDAVIAPLWGSGETLWISFVGARRSDYAWVQPTNYTGLIDRNHGGPDTNVNSTGCRVATSHREFITNVQTIPANGWTYTGVGSPDDSARHGLVAIRPALPPLPPPPAFGVASSLGGASVNESLDHFISMPPGTVPGDLVVIALRVSHYESDPIPAGWSIATSRNSSGWLVILWRVIQSGDPSVLQYTLGTTTTRRAAWVAHRITGAHATAPVANINASIDPPNSSPGWGSEEKLWIIYVAARRAGYYFTMPSPYNSQVDAVSGWQNNSATHAIVSTAHRVSTDVSENPTAWTFTKYDEAFGDPDGPASGVIAIRKA